jgi:bifunctional non-homologous end joining protein LigD
MKGSLDPYIAKRTFSKTPEPRPTADLHRQGPLLFVIQKHHAQRLHYDFRLEFDGVLKSWALPKGPSVRVTDRRMAVLTEDHPFEYAAFEGVIPPKQYGAGKVIVWDCGIYSPDEDQQYSFENRAAAEARMREGFAKGKLSVFLRGERLKGSFTLVRTSTDWLLIKHNDRFARTKDLPFTEDNTAPRGQASSLVPAGPVEKMPEEIRPMMAETADTARSNPDWLYEPKLDGYRVIAFVRGKDVRLQSRRGIDLTSVFPEIICDLASQAGAWMILDGEIVTLDATGRPSFNALQNRVQLKTAAEIARAQKESPSVLVCFDLLHFGGCNLRDAPYMDRRRYLAQCLLPSTHIQLVHVASDAEQLYAAATASGFEGIVAKRKNSTYQPGRRSNSWLKVKATQTTEFVVGGYTKGKGEREALGAFLLGYWAEGQLHYAGHVGSGLTTALVDALHQRMTELARKKSPFSGDVQLHRPTQWLEPQLVVEVTFQDWTPDGLLRAPVFIRIRDDIEPESIARPAKAGASTGEPPRGATPPARKRTATTPQLTAPATELEQILQQLNSTASRVDLAVQDIRLRLTNLDRVYWPAEPELRRPAVTKRDLLRYLTRVSPFMLPHLENRPLTMIRMPEGIHGERFYQKHWDQAMPDFVPTVEVFSDHKDEKHRYILANNLPTLLWLGQNGTLEFHVWHSRAQLGPDSASHGDDYSGSLEALKESVLNYPDYLVFDIDPYIYSGKEAKGAEPELNTRGFHVGRQVALWVRDLLQQMSLDALVKTSGKTGLHVFVPIERTVTFDAARHICETVGRHLLKSHPKEITLEWSTDKRTDKIFIDYNMNVRGKTLNVAYSPRGLPGAPVSMPLTWEELKAAEVMDFTMNNVPARLEKSRDRWQDALSSKYSLSRTFGRPPQTIGSVP